MSDVSSSKQTPWEETEEEVRRRLQRSKSPQTGWFGTILGLAMAAGALVVLLIDR